MCIGQSCKKHLETKWHYQYKAAEAHLTMLLRKNEIDRKRLILNIMG